MRQDCTLEVEVPVLSFCPKETDTGLIDTSERTVDHLPKPTDMRGVRIQLRSLYHRGREMILPQNTYFLLVVVRAERRSHGRTSQVSMLASHGNPLDVLPIA